MGQLIDLTNKKFGRLLVNGPRTSKNRKIFWFCKCDCGIEKWIEGQPLRLGLTKSCGCLKKELVRRNILEKRKLYKIVLLDEEKKNLNNTIDAATSTQGQILNAKILLLADQSETGPSHTDEEVAHTLGISSDKVYYTRAKYSDPNFLKRHNDYSRKRLQNPTARALRLASLRRYEQKPETKALQKHYRQNLPAEVRAQKNAQTKIYRQTPEGKAARKKEVLRQREWRQTPEGKVKTKEKVQRHKPRANQRYNERYRTDAQFRISVSLRKRLNLALKAQNAGKAVRTFELISCALAEL